jgi:hypothetical protein
MSFNLPDDYDVPTSNGGYMKFTKGDNVFRILDDPILGWEGWVETPDGKEPKRFPMDEKPEDTSDFRDGIQHFWAMPVWNYDDEEIQILEITQATIQRAIKGYHADEDWGDPTEYDIKVTREGDGLETSYQVSPKPHSELSDEVQTAWEAADVNLDALFDGGDPFGAETADESGELAEEDIPFG